MSYLTLPLGWLAVQVTVVAGLALLLDAALARRCPAAGAKLLATASALLVLLTAMAFCPVPGWWARAGQALTTPFARPAPAAASQADQAAGDLGDDPPPLLHLPKLPMSGLTFRLEGRSVGPGRIVAGGWLAGVALVGFSLAMGLLSLGRLRRRGRPLSDVALSRDVEELSRTLGIRGRVELLEADCPDLPATVGWLRPAILLPADWRDWDDHDRRAVLAHELAHVRRRDFLSMLVALLGRALHFYHPLARGLTGRLRLRQELAADSLAAALVGGRELYVRALARLALRAEGRPAAGPARLLLSARGGYLVRRIQMLRNKEEARPLSRGMRGALFGALVAVAALTSALRVPAEAKAPPPALAAAEEVPPFDLSYVCTDQTPKVRAVLGFRPGVIVAQAGLAPLVKQYTDLAKGMLKAAGRALPEIEVDDIEQVVLDVHFATQGTGKPGSRSLQLGASGAMVRLKKEVDWEKVLRALCPEVTVKEQGGVKVFQVNAQAIGPVPISFHAPDRRTLVLEVDVKKDGSVRVHKQGKPRVLAAGWKQVDRSAIAFALDNRDGHYAKTFAADVKELAEVKPALKHLQSLAGGADFAGGIRGELHFEANDEAGGQQLLAALKGAFALAQRSARAELAESKDVTETDRALLRLVDDIVSAGSLTASGTDVKASSQVKRPLLELLRKAEIEVKEKE
jgi:beta-lactamase regulating signal transducer with metallopeptidase domain